MACNLEQEIEIELPEYDAGLVVEAYLEPGKPYRLLLSESAAYFDAFPTEADQYLENILVDDARVQVVHQGDTIELENGVFFDFNTFKLYNYQASQVVPENTEEPFELHIETDDGKRVSGTTYLLPKVPIDSVVVQFNDTDTLARVLTYFTDDPNTENFYRRMLHKSSLDSLPEQDFPASDRFVENGQVVFGTGFDFAVGDTVINTLYHITPEYYQFLSSVQNAIIANGNPFAQPGVILSNLEGNTDVIGIFTGLNGDQVFTIIEEQ
jgi:hypothetical protein